MQTLTYKGAVHPWHCDHMGHMNVMWYTGKFDEATWNLFAELGITPSYLRDQQRGIAGVQQNTSYKEELFAGDVVEIHSRVLEVREKAIRFLHEMRNIEKGSVAATTEVDRRPLGPPNEKIMPVPGGHSRSGGGAGTALIPRGSTGDTTRFECR